MKNNATKFVRHRSIMCLPGRLGGWILHLAGETFTVEQALGN